jgi:hypothetical protein
MHWFTLLAGAPVRFPNLDVRGWEGALVTSALSSYRLPRAIRELALDKSGMRYFQRFSHDTAEIYASTPEVLISGGGEWTRPAFRLDRTWNPLLNALIDAINETLDDEAGWAAATLLIPTRSGGDRVEDFIRFVGHSEVEQRRATCVAPDFACGLQMMIPDAYRACGVSGAGADEWIFIDANCPSLNQGFYAAIHQGPVQFVEIASASTMSVADFEREVRARNAGRSYDERGINEHLTVSSRRIRFTPNPVGRTTIHSIDDSYFDAIPNMNNHGQRVEHAAQRLGALAGIGHDDDRELHG